MTTTCPACDEAAQQLSHTFMISCAGCRARSVSRSPQFHEARRTGRQTFEYRELLRLTGLDHATILEAMERDMLNTTKAA